jgi:hypothetical protein
MRRILAIAVLTTALSGVSQAQHVQTRQGFGISFGIGGGSAGLSCDGCDFDRESGMAGYLRIGGYVNPSLMVAGESSGWASSNDGVDQVANFLLAVVVWYPQPESGFHLKGGAGLATGSMDDGIDELTTTGLGIGLGIGYDWRVARNFSLTPHLNYMRSLGAEAKFNDIDLGETLNMDVLQFGLGFTWH